MLYARDYVTVTRSLQSKRSSSSDVDAKLRFINDDVIQRVCVTASSAPKVCCIVFFNVIQSACLSLMCVLLSFESQVCI